MNRYCIITKDNRQGCHVQYNTSIGSTSITASLTSITGSLTCIRTQPTSVNDCNTPTKHARLFSALTQGHWLCYLSQRLAVTRLSSGGRRCRSPLGLCTDSTGYRRFQRRTAPIGPRGSGALCSVPMSRHSLSEAARTLYRVHPPTHPVPT